VANASGAEIDAAHVQSIFASSHPAMRSSMQKDVAAERQLELDAIAGPIVRGGQRHAIAVATTVSLMAAIRARISSAA
jgi:ketopantoate reductase